LFHIDWSWYISTMPTGMAPDVLDGGLQVLAWQRVVHDHVPEARDVVVPHLSDWDWHTACERFAKSSLLEQRQDLRVPVRELFSVIHPAEHRAIQSKR